MIKVVHKLASWYLKRRIEQVERFVAHPEDVQQEWFDRLIQAGLHTAWGQQYGYADIRTVEDFRRQVPVSTYEQLFPWIGRAIEGEADVLWPGRIHWFAKSSGTTNDKSKFIPVTQEALDECHYKAGQDMLALYFHQRPESKLFTGKSLSIGGSHAIHPLNRHARYGDVSAVMLENLPVFYELIRAPRKQVALMPDWEQKLEAMVREVMHEDITAIVGVPTWTLVLIHRMFEKLGGRTHNLLDIWPNLELYCHGGVSFTPYREQFEALIPSPSMAYMDCYNASEGFFGLQDDLSRRDLLLLLDYGIYYEFIPLESLGDPHPPACSLAEVELGRTYAIAISTNAGLWRYLIGDTIVFTSQYPFRFRVAGRTRHFINAFGEELMVENAEMALSVASRQTGAQISNFTAAPIYFQEGKRGGHEWLIEFARIPDDLGAFTRLLDHALRQLNSDYDAKRQGDLALGMPVVRVMPEGTFHAWLKRRGKLGGQHKVPRLANDRSYVEEILGMLTPSNS
jgi:hypothetical protein